MELLCPHCMKKVTVGDDKAGQVLNCPLCQGVFAAPSLPPAPVRSAPPPPAPSPISSTPSTFALEPLEPLPPASTSVAAGPPPTSAPPPPPRPPADYSRRFAFQLRPAVLVCFAPVCLFLIILVLSFFEWHAVLDARAGLSLWRLGFTSEGTGLFTAYVLLTILTFLVSCACMVLELPIVPALPQLALLCRGNRASPSCCCC